MTVEKKTIIRGLIWNAAEKFGVQGVGFIVSILLARMILPEEYGLLAMSGVIRNILTVFLASGMNTALIQKKDVDDLDCCSLFWVNMATSTVIYVAIFFSASWVAAYFNNVLLIMIIRISAIGIFFQGLIFVHNALLQKRMLFRQGAEITLGSLASSWVVGIILAWYGFGVWALVIMGLLETVARVVMCYIVIKWYPRFSFSLERAKSLFNFGYKLLIVGIMNAIYNNIYTILIGKYYSPKELAYFNRGNTSSNFVIGSFTTTLSGVALPVLVHSYHDGDLCRVMRRFILIGQFGAFPLMFLLVAIAKPFTLILLGENWAPAIPFMQIFALYFLFQPMNAIVNHTINATGRSDIFLYLDVVKKIFTIIVILVVIRFDLIVFAFGAVANSLFTCVVNCWYCRRFVNYKIWQQFRDIVPMLLLGALCGAAALMVESLIVNVYLLLIAQVVLFCLLYCAGSFILKLEAFVYIMKELSGRIKGFKGYCQQ